MRILVAPDSFKGTLAAPAVATAVARGIENAGLQADVCPVADGGEGTMDVILAARGGRMAEADVHDPLGSAIRAPYALLDESRALVETAAASDSRGSPPTSWIPYERVPMEPGS